MSKPSSAIEFAFEAASDRYAEIGVDTKTAIERLANISISLHCWQGDDVGGFDRPTKSLGDGLAVTGNYPGKATTADELRSDLEFVYSLIPGQHRLNLHASYGEPVTGPFDRDQVDVENFSRWIDWAKQIGVGMDFNPTFFSHPKVQNGFTLSHPDPSIRRFWIEHGIASRKIGEQLGKQLGSTCINNFWIPDGFKDSPADRLAPRSRLVESLDSIFAVPIDQKHNRDAVECKLFGIGSESYVVGAHEFYLGYALTRNKILCLDSGHFHPTEILSDKISSVLLFVPELLLHISRGVRWDSDHVVTLSDEVRAIAIELVRGEFLEKTHIGLDFFDASINRIAAWIIGTRNVLKAILIALLEPHTRLRELELAGDLTGRLALMEQLKEMPWAAVWDFVCELAEVPTGLGWLDQVRNYEIQVLSGRV